MTGGLRFASKEEARRFVWDRLVRAGVARFPLPPYGRIPNFAGAREAAERLWTVPVFAEARCIKVNPDSPQRYVREMALRRGVVVVMPTPRLRGGFLRFDPAKIPPDRYEEAARLSTCGRWGEPVPLTELPRLDAIVVGSVAVTRDGRRCGKGEGYGDLEYGILRELGHPPVPVATTVHPLQVVDDFPGSPTDVPIAWIVTPEAVLPVKTPPPPPAGIDWEQLTEADLRAMPVLRELQRLRAGGARKGTAG